MKVKDIRNQNPKTFQSIIKKLSIMTHHKLVK